MHLEDRQEARNGLVEQLQDAGEVSLEEKRRLIRAWLAGYWTAHAEVSALLGPSRRRSTGERQRQTD